MNKKLWFYINSGASFSPLSLSPLSWWNNGATYMAADGSQWTDQMGRYNLTAAGTARPTFTAGAQNGLPSYTHDGTTDSLVGAKMTEIDNAAAYSIWMVGKRSVFSYDDNGSTTERLNFLHNSDNLMYGIVAKVAGVSYGTYAQANAFNYSVMIFDGTKTGNANRLKMYGNGVLQTLTFTLTIPATGPSCASGTIKTGRFAGSFFAGQSLEIGIVNRAITSAEAIQLNTYLAAKYAL